MLLVVRGADLLVVVVGVACWVSRVRIVGTLCRIPTRVVCPPIHLKSIFSDFRTPPWLLLRPSASRGLLGRSLHTGCGPGVPVEQGCWRTLHSLLCHAGGARFGWTCGSSLLDALAHARLACGARRGLCWEVCSGAMRWIDWCWMMKLGLLSRMAMESITHNQCNNWRAEEDVAVAGWMDC